MWSLEMTLKLGAAIKGWRVTGSAVPLVIHVSSAGIDNLTLWKVRLGG